MVVDWGPVVVAVGLFILLSPGLLFQIPARMRVVEFGNMYTSGISILVHAVIYFCIYTIIVVTIGVHIIAKTIHKCTNLLYIESAPPQYQFFTPFSTFMPSYY